MKDYYGILGLNRRASSRQVRRRTIKLGKQQHPKANQSTTIDDPKDFIVVVEACDVLYDDDARRIYDLLLDCESGVKNVRPEALEKHKAYIEAKSIRGRKNGEYYASRKIKEFKEDYRVANWWDITAIIPWP